MVLYECGKLDLDAPVQKYCSAFPNKEVPITTRQLLGHLGGIRHDRTHSFDDPEIINTKHVDDPMSGGLDYFKNDPLVAAPGTKFSYSTNGYTRSERKVLRADVRQEAGGGEERGREGRARGVNKRN